MFSIIIPTYNSSSRVIDTIESVLFQNYTSFEIIVQDGYSIDDTVSLVKQYLNRVILNIERDSGVYDAMNRAVRIAKGKYTIFLGAGDCLYDENVLSTIAHRLQHKCPDVICGYVITDSNGEKGIIRVKPNFLYTIRFIPICHQAVFAKTDLLKKRPFDLNYKIGADQDWLMYMKKHKKSFEYIDYPISIYLKDGLSSSEKGNELFSLESQRIHQNYYPYWNKFIKWHRKNRNR